MRIPESELILTPDKRLYHINLKGAEIADDVILVGDPGRVSTVSDFLIDIEYKNAHREFISCTGYFNGRRITVLSTGIGTDNIDIVLNELDAAVNIDTNTREIVSHKRTLNIYRLGTSGSLQEDISVDDIVVSSHTIGLDCLMNFYASAETAGMDDLSTHFKKHMNWLDNLHFPISYKAPGDLGKKFNGFKYGITVTAPGFYGPQDRNLRLKPAIADYHKLLNSFRYNALRITNFEMETSALYGLGSLLGHNCLTACVIIANRMRGEFATDYHKSVRTLIETALNKICSK